jgi:hypothetical protein
VWRSSRAAAAAQASVVRAPFLVAAHHRSGSNFLTDLLQKHDALECLNEPLSMHTRLFREQDLAIWDQADFDPHDLHRILRDEPGVHAFLLELRQYLWKSRAGRVIGFKETCLFGKLGWLSPFIPDLKIIFLRRDMRAIVASALRSKLLGFWNYLDLVPPAFERVFPGYASRVGPGDKATRTAELVAQSVAVRYELARQTLGAFNHCVIDLGHLLNAPDDCLARLVDFLEVPAAAGPLDFLHARRIQTRGGMFSSFRTIEDVEQSWIRQLTPEQLGVIEAVQQHCHPSIRAGIARHAS